MNEIEELSIVEYRHRGEDRWVPVGLHYHTVRDDAEREVAHKRDTWGTDFEFYDWRVSTFRRSARDDSSWAWERAWSGAAEKRTSLATE